MHGQADGLQVNQLHYRKKFQQNNIPQQCFDKLNMTKPLETCQTELVEGLLTLHSKV